LASRVFDVYIAAIPSVGVCLTLQSVDCKVDNNIRSTLKQKAYRDRSVVITPRRIKQP